MATILIPTALRTFTDRQAAVEVAAETVGQAADALAELFPDIRQHLYDEDGGLRSFINIFVGDTNIKETGGLDTALSPNAEVMIVPAIAGGSAA